MTEYTLDKYDFKRYLLNQLPDARQEDLIFWKKTIPIPIDLIYAIFESRGSLLSKYIHHVGAAYLFSWIAREEGRDWVEELSSQPTAQNDKFQLVEIFKKFGDKSGIANLMSELAEMFMLENFRADEFSLAEALCHKGRKYERLYIPPQVRQKVQAVFPELLQHIAISNGDMFSNVVADELKVYRMGFADAFTGIFNKLIEYILANTNSKKGYSNVSSLSIVQEEGPHYEKAEVSYGVITDGSIWEPVYSNARTTFVLNKMHPYADEIRKAGPIAETLLAKLISVLAEKENEIIRLNDKRIIEVFRQDVSREMRLRAENDR
ncbi:hypothetical protein [Arcticibacter sp. MXS-1]|uniref:hypothetical protein n=1 Tax=Arcticibacter sp. MXS-1 TaxID=3341726 RepID=UPI0035A97CC7